MRYIHIKNIEKYHPGYKDRDLIWARVYFKMVQGDPDFEIVKNEVDKWRFVAMICLELEAQGPLPDTDDYWSRKFAIKNRPMSLTLEALQKFWEPVTRNDESVCIEKKVREEGYRREDISVFVAFEKATLESWNTFCDRYPVLSKVKEISEKRRAMLKKRYEKASFRDFQSIIKAIEEQPFLLGENQRKWRISFDWIIENDTNYIKTLERRYKDHSDPDEKHLMPARSR